MLEISAACIVITALLAYALAARLHLSGPLAMVVAGLVVGNQGRALAMSDTTRHHIDLLWELLDEIPNAVLFVLIGLELIVIRFAHGICGSALAATPVTLFARRLTVRPPVRVAGRAFTLPEGSGKVLTWGGLAAGSRSRFASRCRPTQNARRC